MVAQTGRKWHGNKVRKAQRKPAAAAPDADGEEGDLRPSSSCVSTKTLIALLSSMLGFMQLLTFVAWKVAEKPFQDAHSGSGHRVDPMRLLRGRRLHPDSGGLTGPIRRAMAFMGGDSAEDAELDRLYDNAEATLLSPPAGAAVQSPSSGGSPPVIPIAPPVAPSAPAAGLDAAAVAFSLHVEMKVQGRECAVKWQNVGEFPTTEDCARAVLAREGCGSTFMFSYEYPSWGCHCCAPGGEAGDGTANENWDLYAVSDDHSRPQAASSTTEGPTVAPVAKGELRLFPVPQNLEFQDPEHYSILAEDIAVVAEGTEGWPASPEDVRALQTAAELLRRAAARAQQRLQALHKIKGSADVVKRGEQAGAASTVIRRIRVKARSATSVLDEHANWRYRLSCANMECFVEGDSVFGAIAALESTLPQLFADGAVARFRWLQMDDWPEQRLRGLMVDTGRRFIPKQVLFRQVIDGMALVKMNLLHLHLNDFCRFALDLPGFPQLRRPGVHEGQYSVEDVREIVAYAYDRGIRVLPEVDLPGHASGLLPLREQGMEFCEPPPNKKTRPEQAVKVFDDPAGKTREVLKRLLKETMDAFGPSVEWLHVGGDEASPTAQCTKDNIAGLEGFVTKFVVEELKKTPVAWEELRLKDPEEDGVKATAGLNHTIVMAWMKGTARSIASRGHRMISANLHNHYLDFSYKDHPLSFFWYNVSARRGADAPSCTDPTWNKHEGKFLGGLPAEKGRKPADLATAQARCTTLGKSCSGVTCPRNNPNKCEPREGEPYLGDSAKEDSWIKACAGGAEDTEAEKALLRQALLGGMSAMWTDKYSFIYQCGAAHRHWGEKTGTLPNAALMFSRTMDENFGRSLAGMIWPRAAVSAAAMWHYATDIGSAEKVQGVHGPWMAELMRTIFGVESCPPGCDCDELSACGRPYEVLRSSGGQVRQDDLSGCFKPAPQVALDLDSMPPGGDGGARPKQEAMRLCFWKGDDCAGLVCSVDDRAAAGSPASGQDAPMLCKMRRLQTVLANSPGLEDPRILLKRDTPECAPQMAWRDIAPKPAPAPPPPPPGSPPSIIDPNAQPWPSAACGTLRWEMHSMKFLGGYAGSPKPASLQAVQEACLRNPKHNCLGVTCEGHTRDMAAAGVKCTARKGVPFLADTPSTEGGFEVSYTWKCG
eukprot:TRINITY_DN49626_c0_g1_i1.p1 TRINITY_DN49626_c0_g1~~TRINITY_DN49626_c0_g1_i1.p1  ORF type:complete len:1165 (-),score=260.09 TRINITY_DN49626_c0_g1_i1:50-3544(-)